MKLRFDCAMLVEGCRSDNESESVRRGQEEEEEEDGV